MRSTSNSVSKPSKSSIAKRPPSALNRSIDVETKSSIYVGRPTKFGNPWSEKPSRIDPRVVVVESRERAICNYHDWIMGPTALAKQTRADARVELRGCDLVCWCTPEWCHAEILLEIANSKDDKALGL